MPEYKKHLVFIISFIVCGVLISVLVSNIIQQKNERNPTSRNASSKQISFDNATVYYPENVFQVPTQISLGVGLNSSYIPQGTAHYKDFILRTTHSQYTPHPDPKNLNVEIEINYEDINTQQCEISEQDFAIYQYDSRKEVIKLATSIDTKAKIASAKIAALPLEEKKNSKGTTTLERWAYFTLGNKQNRFIAGGCGEKAYVYLNDNKVYNRYSGLVMPYQSSDAVYESNITGATNLGLSFPFVLENSVQKHDLLTDTYATDLTLNQLEKLTYSYEMAPVISVMVQADEKVISRKVDASNRLYILDLDRPNYKVVRVARESSFKTSKGQNIVYILEVSLPYTVDATTYSAIKEYIVNKATSLEFIKPEELQ